MRRRSMVDDYNEIFLVVCTDKKGTFDRVESPWE